MENSDIAQTVRTRYGNISVLNRSNDLISNFLHHYGEWALIEVQFLAKYLPKKARVLDLGGYLGTFSMGLAQSADLDFVAIVEANPAVAPLLARNALNCLPCSHEVISALVVDPLAHHNKEGWVDPSNMGSASFVDAPENAVRVKPVGERIALNTLLERFGPLDLVKMDVEGMEGELLDSCPALLADERVLLWLECNESVASLDLARRLLQTGRPLTYFAWPSHNPGNFNRASQALLPFAHEAGLLLGPEPQPLTANQIQVDCVIRRIFTLEDLRDALWSTPRWAPGEWQNLSRSEVAAIAGHQLVGKSRDGFLHDPLTDAEGTLGSAAWIREAKTRDTENARLRKLVVESIESERQNAQGRRLAEQGYLLQLGLLSQQLNADFAISRADDSEIQSFQTQFVLDQNQVLTQIEKIKKQIAEIQRARPNTFPVDARAVDNFQAYEEMAQLASRLQEQIDERLRNHATAEAALRDQLSSMQGSITWRGAMRLSRMVGAVPFLKSAIRYALRMKRGMS